MTEIKYDKNVLLFLDELTDILIDKGYFSFYEYSVQYMYVLFQKMGQYYFIRHITNNHIAEAQFFE